LRPTKEDIAQYPPPFLSSLNAPVRVTVDRRVFLC